MASEPGRRLNLTKLLLFRALKQALDFFFPASVRRVLLVIGQFSLLPLRPLRFVVFKRSQSREEKLFLSHFFPFGEEKERKRNAGAKKKSRNITVGFALKISLSTEANIIATENGSQTARRKN